MNIKDLKKQNKNLNIDLVEILSHLDPTENCKLTPFLLKMYKKRFSSDDDRQVRRCDSGIKSLLDVSKPSMKQSITNIILDSFGCVNIEYLVKFNEHLENKRISNTDVTSYNSWGEVRDEVSKAELKLVEKELTKQVEVIHQDQEWLVLKPLSFKSSLAYGSNTKWCTAMKYESEYFYNYSKNGILIYVLNKFNGKKYGFYSSPEEFSVWNQVDVRIDSMETFIPHEILLKIKEFSNIERYGNNFQNFSLEAVKEYEKTRAHQEQECSLVEEGDQPRMEEDQQPIMAVVQPMGINEANNYGFDVNI